MIWLFVVPAFLFGMAIGLVIGGWLFREEQCYPS